MHVAHGTLDERQFVALFGRDGRLVGALGFNRPRQVMQYRRLIAERGDRGTTRCELANAVSDRPRERALLTPRFVLVVVVRALLLHRARRCSRRCSRTTSRTQLGAESVAVGIAVGAFAVGAIVLRPFAAGSATGRAGGC